jgi:hypothetical protein
MDDQISHDCGLPPRPPAALSRWALRTLHALIDLGLYHQGDGSPFIHGDMWEMLRTLAAGEPVFSWRMDAAMIAMEDCEPHLLDPDDPLFTPGELIPFGPDN